MSSLRIVPVMVVFVVGWVGSAQAQGSRGWELELEVGQFLAEGERDSDSRYTLYGARARRWIAESWAVDLGVRILDIDEEGDESVDVYFVDLATRYRILDAERIDLVVFGGPGLFRAEFGEGPQSDTFNEFTVHAGLGAQIALGPRAFLRPEVRGRWINGVLDDEIHAEVGVALGIGLGSGSNW